MAGVDPRPISENAERGRRDQEENNRSPRDQGRLVEVDVNFIVTFDLVLRVCD
jgi:hypothetical protein